MCGIAGFHLKKKELVRNHSQMELFADLLLSGIAVRGPQATGFVAVTHDGKKYEVDKRAINAKEFVNVRKRLPKGTRTFAGHTRLATQGSNDVNANLHPVVAGTCFLTHNGSIWNDAELFEKFEIKRNAEVDTEIIPALIHKFGWENAAKAFHELKGSFAIAAVNARHPGEVLLAKGDWSPLNWIETDNFIVWSSTVTSIQDAWKEVLGTPPKFNKFNKLDEGDMLWIKGNVIEPAKFELPTDPFRRADNPAKKGKSASRSGTANGGGKMRPIFARGSKRSDSRASSTNLSRGVIPDRRDKVRTLRDDGYGKAIIYGKVTLEEALRESPGTVNWTTCSGCQELILEASFVNRTGEGRICTDCNYIAEYGNSDKLVVDDASKEALSKWVRREAKAHTRALFEVAKLADLDVAVVDYLVFRMPEKYANEHPHMAELAGKLDDLYQEAHNAAFDDILDEANDKGTEDKQAEKDKPWHLKDNVHPITAKYASVRCGICNAFKANGVPCVKCVKKAQELQQAAKEKAEAAKGNTTVQVGKCWCGEEADIAIGGIAGFCFYHYKHCNHDDCAYGISKLNREEGVVAPANHILSTGKRVCHYHARKQSGAFSDTTLAKRGVVIKELRVHEPAGL